MGFVEKLEGKENVPANSETSSGRPSQNGRLRRTMTDIHDGAAKLLRKLTVPFTSKRKRESSASEDMTKKWLEQVDILVNRCQDDATETKIVDPVKEWIQTCEDLVARTVVLGEALKREAISPSEIDRCIHEYRRKLYNVLSELAIAKQNWEAEEKGSSSMGGIFKAKFWETKQNDAKEKIVKAEEKKPIKLRTSRAGNQRLSQELASQLKELQASVQRVQQRKSPSAFSTFPIPLPRIHETHLFPRVELKTLVPDVSVPDSNRLTEGLNEIRNEMRRLLDQQDGLKAQLHEINQTQNQLNNATPEIVGILQNQLRKLDILAKLPDVPKSNAFENGFETFVRASTPPRRELATVMERRFDS